MTSPSGCWTCRLRHRKCDLRTPACRECRDRCIPCHGYGPKPSWMDGAVAERQELTRIKKAVKQNFRKVRRAQNRDSQAASHRLHGTTSPSPLVPVQSPSTPAAAAAAAAAVTGHPPHSHPWRLSADAENPQTSHNSGTISLGPGNNYVPVQNARSTATSAYSTHLAPSHVFQSRAASLVMHYFDKVFYWQYPYFQSRSRLGNRGWFLSSISSGGPLYHAALALSVLHRNEVGDPWRDYPRDQEAFEYHTKALRELCEFSQRTGTETLLRDKFQLAEFAASSLMLISFQVFHGAEYDWLPHLEAVTTVLSLHSPEALLGKPASPSHTGTTKVGDGYHPNDVQAHPDFEFLILNAIWYDILACVSAGRVPRIEYRQWLERPTLNLEIADLMGCYNWVMTSIGDLAHLQGWVNDMKNKGTLSVPRLVMRTQEIEARLNDGVNELELTMKGNTEVPPATWVSLIFALASLILSNTITSGPLASLPEIRESVGKAVDVLRSWPQTISLRGLVWPLCIIGCMAESEHQPFLQTLLVNFAEECKGLGNASTVLKVVKDYWAAPQRQDKRSSMNLEFMVGVRALFI